MIPFPFNSNQENVSTSRSSISQPNTSEPAASSSQGSQNNNTEQLPNM